MEEKIVGYIIDGFSDIIKDRLFDNIECHNLWLLNVDGGKSILVLRYYKLIGVNFCL